MRNKLFYKHSKDKKPWLISTHCFNVDEFCLLCGKSRVELDRKYYNKKGKLKRIYCAM